MHRFLVVGGFLLLLTTGGFWTAAAVETPPQPISIRVTAGDYHRSGTPVEVAIGDSRANWILVDEKGTLVPHQLTGDGGLIFRIEDLPPGDETTYLLGPSEAPFTPSAPSDLIAHYDDEILRFSYQGSDLFAYRVIPADLDGTGIDPLYRRAGYIHPLNTLKGITVTDEFPPDHLHQSGLFSAWRSAWFDGRRVDFWNLHDGTGRVDVLDLDHAWEGPIAAGFTARHKFTDLTTGEPLPALNETWNLIAYAPDPGDAGAWFLDLDLLQTPATALPLNVRKVDYGGFAARTRREWLGEDNAEVLTADGLSDRIETNGLPTRWFAISGQVDSGKAGLAILDHPQNLWSPQPVRIHPSMPYFCYAPNRLGPFTITEDTPYHARYRVVVFDGEPDPETLDRLWNDFAFPPEVAMIDRR